MIMDQVEWQKAKLAELENEVKQLHPLLKTLLPRIPRVKTVEYTHGGGEMGADFVISRLDDLLHEMEYIGIIAKIGKISQDYSGIERQIKECEIERCFANGKMKVFLTEVWVVATGTISGGAQEKIHAAYKARKIHFIDGDRLYHLIEEHLPDYWRNVTPPVDAKKLQPKAKQYFIHFLNIIDSNTRCETVKIFARLTYLEVRGAIKKFPFPEFFPAVKKAAEENKVRMHYLVFLRNRESMNDPYILKVINAYPIFSEKVSIIFEDEAGSAEDTGETFVLLMDHQWVLTHGWDYSGKISMPIQRMGKDDFLSYSKKYERLIRKSHIYHPTRAKRFEKVPPRS
jgi:hypothetical protein